MTFFLALLMAVAPPPAPASSLERLALEVSRSVSEAGFEGPIGVYVEGSPAPASRAVGSMVMASLAARRLAPVPVTARDATEAERFAREQGLRSLVRLTVSLEPPKLVVRGDALNTWVNFWSGSAPTRTGPAAAVVSMVDADLEALTLVGASAPTSTRPLELNLGVLAKLTAVPAALAIADLDGDHRAEVIALVGDGLVTWSADGRQKGRTELSAPLSTRPSREPFGLLAFSNGKLLAWSSRRDRAESFTWQRDAWRPAGLGDAPARGPVMFSARPGFASFGKELTWAGKPVNWPEPIAQFALFGALALGISPTGTAAIARGLAPTSQLTGVGSGSTLADLDGDGTPEVIATDRKSVV